METHEIKRMIQAIIFTLANNNDLTMDDWIVYCDIISELNTQYKDSLE